MFIIFHFFWAKRGFRLFPKIRGKLWARSNSVWFEKERKCISLRAAKTAGKGRPDCKKLHPLSERLAFLGIRWLNYGNPTNTIVLWWFEGVSGCPALRRKTVVSKKLFQKAWCQKPKLGKTERNLWPRKSLIFLHTEKFFRNHIKTIWNQVVFTIFQLIWNNKRTVSAYCSKSIEKW